MTDALGPLFSAGIGAALSPIPIIAVILMLTTPRGKVTGLGFMVGWLVGLSAATAIVVLVANGADEADSTSADGAHIVTLVIGLLFLALAIKQWKSRPEPGVEPELPKWMAGLDSVSPAKCVGLGLAFSALNPKNLAMAVSAGVALAETGASTGQTVLGAAIFVVIGSLTVAGPVLGSLVAPARMVPVLAAGKQWLGAHNATIMFVLFLLLGATRTGEGLAGLLR